MVHSDKFPWDAVMYAHSLFIVFESRLNSAADLGLLLIPFCGIKAYPGWCYPYLYVRLSWIRPCLICCVICKDIRKKTTEQNSELWQKYGNNTALSNGLPTKWHGSSLLAKLDSFMKCRKKCAQITLTLCQTTYHLYLVRTATVFVWTPVRNIDPRHAAPTDIHSGQRDYGYSSRINIM